MLLAIPTTTTSSCRPDMVGGWPDPTTANGPGRRLPNLVSSPHKATLLDRAAQPNLATVDHVPQLDLARGRMTRPVHSSHYAYHIWPDKASSGRTLPWPATFIFLLVGPGHPPTRSCREKARSSRCSSQILQRSKKKKVESLATLPDPATTSHVWLPAIGFSLWATRQDWSWLDVADGGQIWLWSARLVYGGFFYKRKLGYPFNQTDGLNQKNVFL